jgi:hypothetical protein
MNTSTWSTAAHLEPAAPNRSCCELEILRGCRVEDPIEDVVDVPELFIDIERALDLDSRQDGRDVGIVKQELFEIDLLRD